MSDEIVGYIRNKSNLGTHVMKRYISPNGRIPLEELYQEYGVKHGLERDEQFIEWLFEIKLRNRNKWEVVLEEIPEKKRELSRGTEEGNEIVEKPPNKLAVEEITELSVRKAREVIPTITDIKLLKYAFRDASQRPNKKVLCDIIKTRINDIESLGITS